MDPDADLDRLFWLFGGCPRCGGSDCEASRHGPTGGREDDIEAVTLGLDLCAAEIGDDGANEGAVSVEQVGGGAIAACFREGGEAA